MANAYVNDWSVVPLPLAHVVLAVAVPLLVLTVLTSVAVGAKLTHFESFAVTLMMPVVGADFDDNSAPQLTLLAAPEPVIVMADAARLRQVIDNLISNAMQHTPPGTPVTVTVAGGPGRGQLIVADTGPGMSAEQASRAFERFYRTDRARSRASGGTGLGLSIVAALVAAHAGTVTVDTEPGRGAAFGVQLPLAAAAPVAGDAVPPPGAGRQGPVPALPAPPGR